MGFLQQVNDWSSKHHPKWLVVLRAGLGLCLFIKGIQFIKDTVTLERMVSNIPHLQNVAWLSTFIPWVHLFCGAMILAGLFTRLSCVVQIPILLGAVFFVNSRAGIMEGGSDLLFSIIILLLLIFFAVEGGGRFSLDNGIRHLRS